MTQTPTPWAVREDAIIAADGNFVCFIESDQDAARIVLAVNNHKRLLKMLREVTEQLEDDDMDMRCMDNIVADAARRLLDDLTASQPPHTM